jgi:hypothetical protein
MKYIIFYIKTSSFINIIERFNRNSYYLLIFFFFFGFVFETRMDYYDSKLVLHVDVASSNIMTTSIKRPDTSFQVELRPEQKERNISPQSNNMIDKKIS